jgi:hypothetical protein
MGMSGTDLVNHPLNRLSGASLAQLAAIYGKEAVCDLMKRESMSFATHPALGVVAIPLSVVEACARHSTIADARLWADSVD